MVILVMVNIRHLSFCSVHDWKSIFRGKVCILMAGQQEDSHISVLMGILWGQKAMRVTTAEKPCITEGQEG